MEPDPIPQAIADDPRTVCRVLHDAPDYEWVIDRLERLPSDTNRGFCTPPTVL